MLTFYSWHGSVLAFGGYAFMKTTSIIVLSGLLLCGCSSVGPGSPSEKRRFLSEHPNVTILAMTNNDASEHSQTGIRRYADWGFVYRNADGTEHEEVWHYNYSNHGWHLAKKEQIR